MWTTTLLRRPTTAISARRWRRRRWSRGEQSGGRLRVPAREAGEGQTLEAMAEARGMAVPGTVRKEAAVDIEQIGERDPGEEEE